VPFDRRIELGKRRHRLDEADLIDFLTIALQGSGYMTADEHIIGLEFKTRKIRAGGDYYKDPIDGTEPPGGVELVRWVKVLTDTGRQKATEEIADEPVLEDPA
jgi:hypothetical protein